MAQPGNRNARRLAIALVVAGLGIVALLLLRRDKSHVLRDGTEAPAEPTGGSVELQDPGDDGTRTPPVPPYDARRDPESSAPARPEIRGLVVDDSTGTPIDAFEVLCAPAGAERHYVDTILGLESSDDAASVAFTGSQGRFAITVLDAETQSLCAFAAGYERSEPVTAEPGSDIVIRLKRGGLVRGRVVDPATGNPVEGALVGWLDRQGKARTGSRERFERTDALGRFVLPSVPLSARSVLAGDERLGEGMSEPLGLTPEASQRDVVVELRRSGG
jgi:hypothetical protein